MLKGVSLTSSLVYAPDLGGQRHLYDESWEFPDFSNRIVALALNPSCVFVYWTISLARRRLIQEHFMADWDALPLCLCLYDVTDILFDGYNAPLLRRVSVDPGTNNWYLHNLPSGRNYVVDLATMNHDRLFCLLRSNMVALPPDRSAASRVKIPFAKPLPSTPIDADPALRKPVRRLSSQLKREGATIG
ncbi:DUF4912 domain-containing protein [Alicyclobacillus acidiphilus]|uniref:DUF4912 domain-containing protein n=1 Tax=Alicyclobacillus acidiphilus TaxID=182455 RepID=UPI00146FFCBD|nr:DUF4912 domain-containing protein [Alicyclobacillus acidiphilus]